jgi:hypothetical protein
MIKFAVGCYHFGYKKKTPFNFKLEDYYSALEACLNDIPTINNLVLDPSDFNRTVVEQITENAPPLNDKGVVFPFATYFSFKFDIYLPIHTQEKHCPGGKEDAGCERFRVHVSYQYYAPICFVELLEDNGTGNPSTAIMIIREYLENTINTEDSPIHFEVLGPTPFHADFTVKLESFGADHDTEFKVTTLHPPCYARIRFEANDCRYANIQDAYEDLREYLSNELDTYYYTRIVSVRCALAIGAKLTNALSASWRRKGKRHGLKNGNVL